jgi:outer membrane protein assembly factor BamA
MRLHGSVAAAVCALVMGATAAADEPNNGPGIAPAVPPVPVVPATVEEPAPGPGVIARWLDPATAPFIPVPEIGTDPHSGTTLGLIPVKLRVNDQGEIERIIAPDVFHSQYFGWGSNMRIFGYPSQDTQWTVQGGLKERVERDFDALYLADQTRNAELSWSAEAIYDRSGTPRFFGIGNKSLYTNQTSYLDNQGVMNVSVGRNFSHALQLAYVARMRVVDVLPGVLRDLPSIGTLFPTVPGLGNEHALENTATLTYDTRDSPVIPQSGGRYIAYGGFVSSAFGSSVSYTYCGVEARHYFALGPDMTLAWHAGARYMPSANNAPFWALSSLGGDRSITDEREPLRDDGADRFIDRNMFASGAELRTRVTGFDAFGTHVSLEIAPFIDTGKVFASAGTSPLTQLHTAAGFGVRGVASPFVVGYVDIGYGHGQPAVFSGINYPF